MDAWLFVRACLGVVGITLAVSMIRRARLARRTAELAIVEDLIEEAIESTPNATTEGVVRIVLRDLGERGYPERVRALATVEHVEEVQRARRRRVRNKARSKS